ncbi:hypothetical protein [Allorhodopirellula solitaria]|uniref:Uncharacterized protein n=1 Tax=Allorhodopirellula solitaria TaxID=2527987 RepID=A0A5C5X2M7_9BACT|nr:hypothetical protein [Allorhodopirellula solitaria]TWT56511.1 hypothetical protein CA85_40420 [Allorhodopirellula solitaria]
MIRDSAYRSIDKWAIGHHYPMIPRPHTWRDLVELEPRLGVLAKRVEQAGCGCRRRRTLDWWRKWESIKRSAAKLVGWHVRDELLGTSIAYEIAIAELFGRFAGSRRAGR